MPANPDETMAALSPPITPISARPIPSPSRPAGHGHRRGGSEFVGGSIRDGSSIAVMSTSPTKSDGGFASSTLQPPVRKGHRRGVSGAISTNELPLLRPQPDFLMPRGGSAPSSPTMFRPGEDTLLSLGDQSHALPGPVKPIATTRASTESIKNDQWTPVSAFLDKDEMSPKHPRLPRARVGFSDTLEFIPRPLSLVSTDTSSTITARPGHSVSGSISSIISAASPHDRETLAPPARSPTLAIVDPRPSTAGAVLERTAKSKEIGDGAVPPRRRNSIPSLVNAVKTDSITMDSSNPNRTPKRWSFFGLEPFTGPTPPPKHRTLSSSSSESISKAVSAASSSDRETDSSDEDGVEDDTKFAHKEGRRASRKDRVKGWAGSILPLRSSKKRSKVHALRPPTPPASISVADEEEEGNERGDFMENEPASNPPVFTVTASPPTGVPNMPRHKTHEEGSYPMIDLDAALGPFNTPLPHNPEWDAAQRAAGNIAHKRRLHSAQGMKGFVGPGMHYHRRAESAPDLPPFDTGRTGISRFGSNPTMADVFEEEEEDDGEGKRNHTRPNICVPETAWASESEGELTPPATQSTADSMGDHAVGEPSSAPVSRRSSQGTGTTDRVVLAHAVRTERSRTSLHEEVIAEDSPSIIFRSASTFPGPSVEQPRSGSSSPRLAPPGQRELAAIEVHAGAPLGNSLAMPVSPYSTSHGSSSYPSPRSPMSVDAQRISTAASSINEENSFHSLLMGEPGPEVRLSGDYDIPSLTSSNSTMTRESAPPLPNARMSQPNLRDQRPMSVSSAAFGRRRSSLVSLSRLISSAHGERSKLSMEVTMDNEAEDKRRIRPKGSKTSRLSRMMQFWKPSKDDSL